MPLDYSEYPDDWNEIRARILIRANNRCEKCGLQNHAIILKSDRKSPSPQQLDIYNSLLHNSYSIQQAMNRMGFTKIVLTIAHLDHDKDNHQVSEDRLAAWCQKCHLGYDMSRHVANRKYGRNHTKNQFKLF